MQEDALLEARKKNSTAPEIEETDRSDAIDESRLTTGEHEVQSDVASDEAQDVRAVAGSVIRDRYTLERVLGTGGMGTVWRAHDKSLDSICAIKLIDKDKAKDPEVRVRFEREAKASAQLRGAHVVDVLDYGIWHNVPYIAMELLQGEDLADRLARRGRLSAQETYVIVAQVSRALARAHHQGIVHRDLKPENIFLVSDGEDEIAKVLDFGIAKHERYSISDTTTKIGEFLGTPHYVSPEQARGEPTDGRSDLWAMAVIAFQCLAGRLPFWSESLGTLMGQILYETIPVPSDVAPDLPAGFDAWWARAAQRRPDERFQSARELADTLAEALGVTEKLAVPDLVPHRASLSPPPPPTLRPVGDRGSVRPPAASDAQQVDGSPWPGEVSRNSSMPPMPSVPAERNSDLPAAGRVSGIFGAAPSAQIPQALRPLVERLAAAPRWTWAVSLGVLVLVLALMLSGSDEPTGDGVVLDAVQKEGAPQNKNGPEPVVAPVADSPKAAKKDESSVIKLEDLDLERKAREAEMADDAKKRPVPRAKPRSKQPSFKPTDADYGI